MPDQRPRLTVQISGAPAAGKTLLACLIRLLLKPLGYHVEIEDDTDELHLLGRYHQDAAGLIERSRRGEPFEVHRDVSISTLRDPREWPNA